MREEPARQGGPQGYSGASYDAGPLDGSGGGDTARRGLIPATPRRARNVSQPVRKHGRVRNARPAACPLFTFFIFPGKISQKSYKLAQHMGKGDVKWTVCVLCGRKFEKDGDKLCRNCRGFSSEPTRETAWRPTIETAGSEYKYKNRGR